VRTNRLIKAAVVGTVLSLAIAGCGGGDEEEPAEGGEPTQAAEPAVWPLTGIEADGEVAKDHPVLVAKIDNSSSSQPQVGLSKADLVVEELVEGNTTRLAAFFYSTVPAEVGPVRSMRASDIGIVSPVDGTIITSGAAGVTIQRIKEAGIPFYSEGGPGFSRATDRSAPYNLMNNPRDVARAEKGEPATPAAYLPWGSAGDLPKGKPVSSIAADFGGHVTNWEYRRGGYVNTNSYAGADDQFPADTVLVLKVQVGDAGYRDPAGSFVPETEFSGKGKAFLFHGGRMVRATWSKSAEDAQLELSTADGDLTVPAGRTWLELVPANDAGGNIRPGGVTFQK
jgi:hypothetical protein